MAATWGSKYIGWAHQLVAQAGEHCGAAVDGAVRDVPLRK